jgi:acyl carrier protein
MEDLFALVEDVFEIDGNDCDGDTVINELENWDSLKYMEFIVSIEERYGVSLTGDEIAGFRTLDDVIKTISTKAV